MTKIAILGAGSWGTALAIVFSRSERKHDISLWVHDAALAASLHRTRENDAYLPHHSLPVNVSVTNNLKEAVFGATIVAPETASLRLLVTLTFTGREW